MHASVYVQFWRDFENNNNNNNNNYNYYYYIELTQ